MPRSPKSHGSPEGPLDRPLDNPEARRRVTRACQRCRLKKCKCDGATPCTRCKSDDAICAYGKHQKSDKTVYRSGYVQMLERQHAQLIAGLQALYRCTQNGDRWTGPRLELVNHNQPLTHKILEALGVLRTDEWEDMESVDGTWQGFERHIQDDNQAAFSPTSPTQTAFPQSEIMSKRRSKDPNSLASTTQTLSMPPLLMATLISVKPDPYNMTMPLDTFPSNELTNEDLDRTPESMMDWSFGMDDLFGNLGGQEQTVKIC